MKKFYVLFSFLVLLSISSFAFNIDAMEARFGLAYPQDDILDKGLNFNGKILFGTQNQNVSIAADIMYTIFEGDNNTVAKYDYSDLGLSFGVRFSTNEVNSIKYYIGAGLGLHIQMYEWEEHVAKSGVNEGDETQTGLGGYLLGGFNYYLFDNMALSAQLRHDIISDNDDLFMTIDNDNNYSVVSLGFILDF